MKRKLFLFFLLLCGSLYSRPFSSQFYKFSVEIPDGFRKVLDKEVEEGIRQYRFSSSDEKASFDILVALNNPDYNLATSLILKGIGVSVLSRTPVVFKKGRAERIVGSFDDEGNECYIEGIFLKANDVFYAIGCYTFSDDRNRFVSLFNKILESFNPLVYEAENKVTNSNNLKEEFPGIDNKENIQEDNGEAKKQKNRIENVNKNKKYRFEHEWFFYKKWNLSFEMDSYIIRQSERELMNLEKIDYRKILNVLPHRVDDEEAERFYRNYVFKSVYENNKNRIDSLFLAFERIRRNAGLDDEGFLNLLISFVQSFKFKEEKSGFFKVLPPPIFLLKKCGDSATKSLFLKMLLERFGYDCVLYCSSYYMHFMVGININGNGNYRTINGKKYYFLETAEPGWKIGMILPAWDNLDWWYALDLK